MSDGGSTGTRVRRGDLVVVHQHHRDFVLQSEARLGHPASGAGHSYPAPAARLTAVAVTLAEITDANREAIFALRVAPAQERFVGGSAQDALAEAEEYPHAKPWYRAVFAGDLPVGFMMLSWNVEPQPPRDHRAVVLVEAAH